MSTFRVTSIDVDKNPCKLGDNSLEFDQLKGQVSNYLNYMGAKTGLSPSAIICSMTLNRTLIDELLNNNEGAEGIRIYLIKESDNIDTQTDISFLTLSVKTATDVPNQGMLVEMTPPETIAPLMPEPEMTKTSILDEESVGLLADLPEPEINTAAISTIATFAGAQPLLALKVVCPTGACPPATAMKTNHLLLP